MFTKRTTLRQFYSLKPCSLSAHQVYWNVRFLKFTRQSLFSHMNFTFFLTSRCVLKLEKKKKLNVTFMFCCVLFSIGCTGYSMQHTVKKEEKSLQKFRRGIFIEKVWKMCGNSIEKVWEKWFVILCWKLCWINCQKFGLKNYLKKQGREKGGKLAGQIVWKNW